MDVTFCSRQDRRRGQKYENQQQSDFFQHITVTLDDPTAAKERLSRSISVMEIRRSKRFGDSGSAESFFYIGKHGLRVAGTNVERTSKPVSLTEG